MTLPPAQKAEIRAVMHAYATAYCTRDFLGMMAIFSLEIWGYGSGPDEIIRNHRDVVRQIRRDMGQATVRAAGFSDTTISGDGRVARVATRSAITLAVAGSPAQTMHGRSTMVQRNTGSRWLIEQIHVSLPYGGQAAGQSFPGA